MIPSNFPPKHMARIFEIRHGDGGKPLAWWKVAIIARGEGIRCNEWDLCRWAKEAERGGVGAWLWYS